MKSVIPVCFCLCLSLPAVAVPTVTKPVGTLDVKSAYEEADLGNPAAQFFLGRSYCIGADVPVDYAQAAKWFRKAAEQGYVDAQCELGFLYEVGAGVPQDPVEALRWYRSAADHGHAAALDSLGTMYFYGKGVATNHVQGLGYLLMARAYQGREFSLGKFESEMTAEAIHHAKEETVASLKMLHPLSAYLISSPTYPEPERIQQDSFPQLPNYNDSTNRQAIIQLFRVGQDGKAKVRLLKELSEQGVPYAQLQLGHAYEIGEGVPKDHALAAQWYRKAAEQGNADAQYNLGMMYSEGDGVPADNNEAKKWFSAATESIKPAHQWTQAERLQWDLDNRLTRLTKPAAIAYTFCLVAQKAGNPDAKPLIEELAKKLTPNQAAACRYYADFIWVRIHPE